MRPMCRIALPNGSRTDKISRYSVIGPSGFIIARFEPRGEFYPRKARIGETIQVTFRSARNSFARFHLGRWGFYLVPSFIAKFDGSYDIRGKSQRLWYTIVPSDLEAYKKTKRNRFPLQSYKDLSTWEFIWNITGLYVLLCVHMFKYIWLFIPYY